ncbi:MAG: NlpC/P60 family protein [Gammaproteobacteria bacterium]|nr:NlpC/P60 family protein [Gammaproteobacteria bacterium]
MNCILKMIYRLLLTVFICLTLAAMAGCAGSPKKQQATVSSYTSKPQSTVQHKPGTTYASLNQQYNRWKGTPYELGGLNKNGIDCSGFVHVAFREAFGMQLPRSTEGLAESGRTIAKHELAVGDLVFFKTGFRKHHVGIYMGKEQFIHASTSSGVMKSSLNNPYWLQHYWKSTRLLSN